MERDFKKLINDYQKKFFNAPPNSKRGQYFLTDYFRIIELAGVENTREVFEAIDIAFPAGIMIGYNARKAEEKEIRKRGKKNEA